MISLQRGLYTLLMTLLIPVYLLRLLLRSRKAPAYRKRIAERFALAGVKVDSEPLWIHAVSVGETVAIAPLVERLLATQPELSILMTTTTPTGAERVKALFGDRVSHCYCPYDLPWTVSRFIARYQPRGLVIVETELWPNLLRGCRGKLPVLLANARMSERSARGYARLARLTRSMLADIDLVSAQYAADGQRLLSLGLPESRLEVIGSIKFDIQVPESCELVAAQLRADSQRPSVLLASSHDGEEGMFLEQLALLWSQFPELLLYIVPRHPERFDAVVEIAQAQFGAEAVGRRSQGAPEAKHRIYIGDSMGELMGFYAAADVAVVGGSFVAVGGHNPIEPAALGKPIVMGPEQFNFATICQQLEQAHGLQTCQTANELPEKLLSLLHNPEQRYRMGYCARQYFETQQGALDRLEALVQRQLLN